MTDTDVQKVGLVAGWGGFPVHVAKALRASGKKVVCVGVHDHADPVLAEICDEFCWMGMAKMGRQARYFRRHGVDTATLAGKIFKTRILERFAFFKHMPDWAVWKHFAPMFLARRKNLRDDTLLLTVTQLFQSYGVTMTPATDFAPELLIQEGTLTGKVNHKVENDISFGWKLAKQMGGMDVGQSVVVKNQTVLAIEAVEGTDECIRRAGSLCKAGGFVVVKVAKPNQDMRFDVPTIGIGTIETVHAAGGKVIAIEAGKTIVLEREQLIARAKQLGITVVARLDSEMNLTDQNSEAA